MRFRRGPIRMRLAGTSASEPLLLRQAIGKP